MDGKADFMIDDQGNGFLIDGLALAVVEKLLSEPSQRRKDRLEVGTALFFHTALANDYVCREALLHDLERLRISEIDQVDICIPDAARKLGEHWLADTLSFAEVSRASARLFAYCKSIGGDWSGMSRPSDSASILLTSIQRDDHIIGPAVLSQQLRRRGHSVTLMSNASAEDICKRLRTEHFDCIMVSLSTLIGVANVTKAIKNFRNSTHSSLPIFLGGAALDQLDGLQDVTGADMVTNDINLALAALASSRSVIKAAE